jgi:hypothetical protein
MIGQRDGVISRETSFKKLDKKRPEGKWPTTRRAKMTIPEII